MCTISAGHHVSNVHTENACLLFNVCRWFLSRLASILERFEEGAELTATPVVVADPYLNTDAGTMSPFEHGEVFVLDDGGEVSISTLFASI